MVRYKVCFPTLSQKKCFLLILSFKISAAPRFNNFPFIQLCPTMNGVLFFFILNVPSGGSAFLLLPVTWRRREQREKKRGGGGSPTDTNRKRVGTACPPARSVAKAERQPGGDRCEAESGFLLLIFYVKLRTGHTGWYYLPAVRCSGTFFGDGTPESD